MCGATGGADRGSDGSAGVGGPLDARPSADKNIYTVSENKPVLYVILGAAGAGRRRAGGGHQRVHGAVLRRALQELRRAADQDAAAVSYTHLTLLTKRIV